MTLTRATLDQIWNQLRTYTIPMTDEPTIDAIPEIEAATMVPVPALGDLTAQYEAVVRAQMNAVLQAPEPPRPDFETRAATGTRPIRFPQDFLVTGLAPAEQLHPEPRANPAWFTLGEQAPTPTRPGFHMIGRFQISHNYVNIQTDKGIIVIDLKTGAVTSPDEMGPLDAGQAFWDAVEVTLRLMPEQPPLTMVPGAQIGDPWDAVNGIDVGQNPEM